ncbi:hypothetical protein B5C06_11660 [Staphylococcus delphini]|nr:hypothetical protein B5C06_11660 [Staphylococcus delphini]PCF76192.1 hypothetical protein B4W73_04695 [Staphylococcus delphini]VED62848.1 Uncharacterised protein [Staphylococcus delphini]
MKKRFYCKHGFTLPLLFIILSAYFTFISFYLLIYSLKLQTIDALSDDYEYQIARIIDKGE